MIGTRKKRYFVKGSWLCSLDKELTEEEFIKRAGGIMRLIPFMGSPFVGLIDLDGKAIVAVFESGYDIALWMALNGYEKFQVMEWKK